MSDSLTTTSDDTANWELTPGENEESVEIADDDPSTSTPLNAPTPEILTESRLQDLENRFRAEVEREREARQLLEQRLHNTQAWGNQRHQEASLAQQLLEANRQARLEVEAEARRRQELTPPSLSPEEREAFGGILDPDLLEQKFRQYSEWGARTALIEMAPHLQRAERTQQELSVMSQILPSVIEQTRSQALAAALSRVVEEGHMTYEEAEAVVPDVYSNFEAYGGPAGALKSSMDPNVVATAIQVMHLHKSGGVRPVGSRQAPKPRTLGSSSSPASSGKNGASRIQVTASEAAEIRKVESELGQKLPVEAIRRVLSARRQNA